MAYIRRSEYSSIYIYSSGGDGEGLEQEFECCSCTLNQGITVTLCGYRQLGEHFLLHYYLMEVHLESARWFFERFLLEINKLSMELFDQIKEAKEWIESLQFEIEDNIVDTYVDRKKALYRKIFACFPFKQYLVKRFVYPVKVPYPEILKKYYRKIATLEVPASVREIIGKQHFLESGVIDPGCLVKSRPQVDGHFFEVH